MKSKTSLTALSSFVIAAVMGITTFAQNFTVARNMGPILNTASNETGPVMSPSGLSLYFTSNRPGGQGGNDIYVSQRATLGSAWGSPQNLGATLNSDSNDNVTGISLDGRSLLITSNRPDTFGGLDIYISRRTNTNNDFDWTTPVNLGATINSTFQDISADFFEDPVSGVVSLIFSSDRIFQDGLAFRFYQSTRNPDGTYNTPVLIDELNGDGGHFGPAIRRDGLEIYFSSGRLGGINLPKTDIWRSTRPSTSAPWNTPVLVAGINDMEDERQPKLSPDGAILYFSSPRTPGYGGFDLYSATRCSLYSAPQASQRAMCF